MRGGAIALAALFVSCLRPAWSKPPRAQPLRTRDLGFATVRYDNGLTFGALTLSEELAIRTSNSITAAHGLVSVFNDSRWSMQGSLVGRKFSAPMQTHRWLRPLFQSFSGEVGLEANSTAQQSLMPTFQLLGSTRLYFNNENFGARASGSLARTFDREQWRTTVMGETFGWARRNGTMVTYAWRPVQLQYGDVLYDNEAGVEVSRGSALFGLTMGVRIGEVLRGTVGWGTLSATLPIREDVMLSFSAGSYPADLVQGLPGGSYAAVAMRLPNGRFPPLRRPIPLPPPPIPEPELPITERLALTMGPALDTLHLRRIRVWAPGAERVELMADFVDWVPVPLIKQANGEWQGFYRVRPGAHRLNLLIDGKDLDVPVNLVRVRDDFSGTVGLIVVR